jgi:hypothetical protein
VSKAIEVMNNLCSFSWFTVSCFPKKPHSRFGAQTQRILGICETIINSLWLIGNNTAAALENLAAIADTVTTNLGHPQVYLGTNGGPIFIIQENHGSYLCNLEEAAILLRLSHDINLKDIGLEGFVQEDANKWPPITNYSVRSAFQMIKEGEVNSAEFMYLSSNTTVHPIEHAADYRNIDDAASRKAVNAYILALAQKHFNDKIKDGTVDPAVLAEAQRLRASHSPNLGEYIVSKDSFDTRIIERFKNLRPDNFDETEEIRILKDLVSEADRINASVESYKETMRSYIAFDEARRNASRTMSKAVGLIADGNVPVAMIIGGAHTKDVANYLRGENRPVVVITPLSYDKKSRWDFNGVEYQYKEEELPLDQGVLGKTTVAVFARRSIKPKPGMLNVWPAARSELYLFVDDIVRTAFASPSSSPIVAQGNGAGDGGINEPPITLSGEISDPKSLPIVLNNRNRKEGKYIEVDTDHMEVIKQGNRDVLLFAVTLKNPDDEKRNQKIWIKAAPTNEALHPLGFDAVEGLQKAKDTGRKTSSGGEVQEFDITSTTEVAIATDKDKLTKTNIRLE